MAHANLTASPAEREPTGPSLLIIDDHVAVREGLARLLRSAPLSLRGVYAVATAAEALACVESLGPELVVLDADLAGEDGLTLLPTLSRHAHVMVLTCMSDPGTRHRALGLGASAFVSKHESASHLLSEVKELAARYLRGELPPMRGGGESGARPGTSSDVAEAPSP